jgi:DNA-directed RNA polymerase subunit RPC12/RpoP
VAKKDYEFKLSKERQKTTYYCKNCGHSIFIENKYNRIVCDHCGTMVYKEGKSVYDIIFEKQLKARYKKFLEEKQK